MSDVNFKFNAKKCTFSANEIEYLGYVLARNSIKPQKKRCKLYLLYNCPKAVEQLRAFLIVQYF